MKRLCIAAVWTVTAFLLEAAVFAQAEAPAPVKQWTLASAGRFFGYFLLVMAMIYGALLLTSWIGKKWGKK